MAAQAELRQPWRLNSARPAGMNQPTGTLPTWLREIEILGCVLEQGSWRGRDLGRGWEWATIKVVIGDGAVWIWNLADQHFPGAIQIVDL